MRVRPPWRRPPTESSSPLTSTSCLVPTAADWFGTSRPTCAGHRLLWNHGDAADDLARAGVVSVPAPASTHLVPLLTLCRRRGVESVLLVAGSGPFARQVIEGATHEAATIGLPVSVAEVASWRVPASLAGRALLIAGTFDEDVEAVRRIRTAAVEVELVGCVAAGIHEFQARLGPLAEGVLAPAQWVNRDHPVEVGPTAAAFARRFEARTGWIPDYPAALAAATGWLAAEATRRGLAAEQYDLPAAAPGSVAYCSRPPNPSLPGPCGRSSWPCAWRRWPAAWCRPPRHGRARPGRRAGTPPAPARRGRPGRRGGAGGTR